MDLKLEVLDEVKAPLSNEFWEGVAIGIAIGVIIAT
jgi:hypothetical protein